MTASNRLTQNSIGCVDLNLGGQYSDPVVDILRDRGIPFIIMSGDDVGKLRPDLAEAPQIRAWLGDRFG